MNEPTLDNNKMFPARPIVLFVAVFIFFTLGQVVAMFVPLIPQVTTIVAQLVFILGAAIVYRRFYARADTTFPSLKKLGVSPLALLVVVVASIVLGFLANALGALTVLVFPGLEPMAELYQETIESLLIDAPLYAQVLGAIGVVVVAPVAEEILFRGTILPEQRREQIAVSAILLNGILFSLMHQNPVAFVALAVVGCYFAHITLKSGALWPAIIGHAALNLVNGVILLRVIDEVPDAADITVGEISVALALLLPLSIVVWWLSVYLMDDSD